MKPNSPTLMLSSNPPMVAIMNPAAITTMRSRRDSKRSTARSAPAIPWTRNNGPIAGMVR